MGKYTLISNSFPPLDDGANSHKGTGNHSDFDNVIKASSVTHNVADPLEFEFKKWDITVLSLEIATTEAPNWFGVSFRKGITAFDTVNIFCHPTPTIAKMDDPQYPTRSGNWPRLFRYAQIFGRQMSIAGTNHITIIPFFTNASYGSTGLFGANWKDIVEQIIGIVKGSAKAGTAAPVAGAGGPRAGVTRFETLEHNQASAKKGDRPPPPPVSTSGSLKNVVLSDFSHGRVLMGTVRNHAKGIGGYLKEIWDFDGVHANMPLSSGGVTGIVYNQSHTSHQELFPVPPERWVSFHKTIIPEKALHGDIPAFMALHAATISRVGH